MTMKPTLFFSIPIVAIAMLLNGGGVTSVAAEPSMDEETKIEVRKDEENAFKRDDDSYFKQSQLLAEQYKTQAEQAVNAGRTDEAKALNAAAAYFDQEAQKYTPDPARQALR